MTPRPGAAAARLVVFGCAAALVALVAAVPASAHATLLRTVPGNGSSVQQAPRTITMQFDEAVSAGLSRVTIMGAKTGVVSSLRVMQAGGSTLAVELPPLPRDLYRMQWSAVSADDLHPSGGTLLFGVRTRAPAASSSTGEASPPGAVAEEVALRWEEFIAVAVLVGALAALLFVVPAAAQRGARGLELLSRPLAWLAIVGWLAALAADEALLLIQVGRVGSYGLGRVLVETGYGRAWIAREVILVALACALLALLRTPSSRRLAIVAGALSLGLVASLALVSHAASVKGAASLTTAILALHLLAAAVWVGGVAALCLATMVLVRAGERPAARILALTFGRFALVWVGLIAVTGVAILGSHVHSLDALVSTGYGQTLIVKTGLFLLAGAVGLCTTIVLRSPRAPRGLGGSWSWTPRLELAVLLAILLSVSLLTASAPARQSAVRAVGNAPAGRAAPTTYATVGDLLLSVAVEPNRPGQNFVTVGVLSTRRPAPAPVSAVNVSLARADGGTRSLALDSIGSDQWQSVTKLPPGTVRIAVAVKRPGLPTSSATTVRSVRSVPLPIPRTQAGDGLMDRPLEPILRPVAIVGAVLLLLVILEVPLGSAIRRPRRSGQLRPRRVGR